MVVVRAAVRAGGGVGGDSCGRLKIMAHAAVVRVKEKVSGKEMGT